MNIASIDFLNLFLQPLCTSLLWGCSTSWELRRVRRQGWPQCSSATTDGAQFHRVWAWQAELAPSDRVCWHSQLRWSNEVPSRSLRPGWRQSHIVGPKPPRRQGQRQNWVHVTPCVWGIFPEESFLQPKSIQELKPEAGLLTGVPAVKFRQRAGGQTQSKSGCRGTAWSPLESSPRHQRLVVPSGTDTFSSLMGWKVACSLYCHLTWILII